MSRFRAPVLACSCGLALAVATAWAQQPEQPAAKVRQDEPVARQAPKPAKKADAAEAVLAALADEADLGDKNLSDTPLLELLQDLSKKHRVSFVVNEAAFAAVGRPSTRDAKSSAQATQLRGLSVHQLLAVVLESLDATYLVRNGGVEIVPVQYAAAVTKSSLTTDEGEAGRSRLAEPLVSVIVKEKPLNEAVAKVAEAYELNVVVAPQSGDARTGFVTARLLNVPASQALDLLALQCDLRVVRKGNAFLITSRDQANDLFEEKLDRERKTIEVEKLREAPAKPPAPPAPPVPPAPPALDKPPAPLAPVPPKAPVLSESGTSLRAARP